MPAHALLNSCAFCASLRPPAFGFSISADLLAPSEYECGRRECRVRSSAAKLVRFRVPNSFSNSSFFNLRAFAAFTFRFWNGKLFGSSGTCFFGGLVFSKRCLAFFTASLNPLPFALCSMPDRFPAIPPNYPRSASRTYNACPVSLSAVSRL